VAKVRSTSRPTVYAKRYFGNAAYAQVTDFHGPTLELNNKYLNEVDNVPARFTPDEALRLAEWIVTLWGDK
jgi:hypothetical protein